MLYLIVLAKIQPVHPGSCEQLSGFPLAATAQVHEFLSKPTERFPNTRAGACVLFHLEVTRQNFCPTVTARTTQWLFTLRDGAGTTESPAESLFFLYFIIL